MNRCAMARRTARSGSITRSRNRVAEGLTARDFRAKMSVDLPDIFARKDNYDNQNPEE